MAAKKKTKAKKKTATKKKKVAAKAKPAAKKKVSKKKTAKKKKVIAKAKPAAKKKLAKKKSVSTKKKSSMTKKKVTKKVSKKTAVKKKAVSKKKVAKKAAVKKKTVAKKGKGAAEGPSFVPYEPMRHEEYMSPQQLEHFQNILLNWKQELLEEVNRTVDHMKEDASNFADPADRATQEEEFGLELRTRDRERKLLRKINSALQRIEDGTYGYCEETGEEIGIKRLEARPVATLCLEAQERRELRKRQFGDREDRER